MRRRKQRATKKIFRIISGILMVLLFVPFVVLLLSNQLIRVSSESYLYNDAERIPYNTVGLVLGTSHRVRNGGPNPYFHHRMEAAASLYHAGKVSYLLVSGDNRTVWYNEPEQMRQQLVELGVPDHVIYADHAGLRTRDSVIRCSEVFGQDSFTIISQRFQNQRAVFIARNLNLNVVAFNAADVDHQQNSRIQIREWFARIVVFLDILKGTGPERTDEKVIIGSR
jgi:SanA protein